ncbi:subtilisin-like protein [Ceraceosorus guamensis]|uniref:tripeptidyl-peptidase II n=1 Tax=Ceraceosorus guamensis TaxID=1522189 RepID=A0A316W9T0_9BASI|nr:subtilisin-like protein [Ceraceosorus guamensis]PWN44753.1 subtilisin-like protein [Ceraceosorus guamensis]
MADALQYEIHEKRSVYPNWNRVGRLDKRTQLPMRIALKQSNMENLDALLSAVSDPNSEQYGKHWTPEQVHEHFAPSDETVNVVKSWLQSHGSIDASRIRQSASKGWLELHVSVAEAERLLNTEYHGWVHASSAGRAAADIKVHPAVMNAYSLPSHIREHVDFITPTLHFDVRPDLEKRDPSENLDSILEKRANGHAVRPIGAPGSGSLPKVRPIPQSAFPLIDELKDCSNNVTPNCLRALYKFPALPSFTPINPKNGLGIVEYTPQSYIDTDLDLFFGNYSKNQVQKRPKLESISGGKVDFNNKNVDLNAESNLDLEYGMALVNPIPVTLYQVGEGQAADSFNNFLDAFDASYCAGDDPVQDGVYPDPKTGVQKTCGTLKALPTISTSYGYNEADLTPEYEVRQCNEYAKLGLQGSTFLYSSGDYGVAGNGGQCIDPNTGDYTAGTTKGDKFNPSFPGGCPYVLSIGATQITLNQTVLAPETACNSVIYSGGGFSNVFGLPDYQSSAVKSWFATAPQAKAYSSIQYNNSQKTRGFPDVSANGARYVVALDGSYKYHLYGTSASAPTFASILTLINEARFAIGKGSVGFVNPVLYKNPYLLTDITNGTNPGCGTEGFAAVKGWDPVTGLGTPDYPKLLAYFLAH